MISASSIIAICISLLFSIIFPIFLFVAFKKKTGCGIKPFLVGCAVFFVFAIVLESVCHAAISVTEFGKKIIINPFMFSIYGGLTAGIFEETGRFIAFKTILKKEINNDKTALMYGAGHGGFEVFFILFTGMITNLVFAIFINTGNIDLLREKIGIQGIDALNLTLQTLVNTKPRLYFVGILERFSAVIIHISLSIWVWFAAKDTKKIWMFPVAIILHGMIDFIAGIANNLEWPIAVTELLLIIYSVCILFITVKFIWLKNSKKEL